ncbi:GNAT family N-acetyltransferase [Nonomuraea africana]|uniref:GNAT superfamily N-acetyltransferase n=1 Tax=Nonomuraea africana TaxID=46171 RepID=A0ABR9KN60_9ACTN|nr:GNAT family N-acetyltransferase [Nonomuraea africana]MBE1563459.1 GNAT superfamily N-acetyltransferase [Nonomuraea africana]
MIHLRQATPDDFPEIIGLIENAATWLADKDTDQWQRPWPDREARDARVMGGIKERLTWVEERDGRLAATVTLTSAVQRELWAEHDPDTAALYLHRLVVHRDHAGHGLGAEIIDWAEARGPGLLRIDVWKTNESLHKYYLRQGFEFVGMSRLPGYPSAALFHRKMVTVG